MFERDGLPSSVIAKATGKAKRKRGQIYGHVTNRPEYSYAGISYRINATGSGCVTKYLQRTIEQIGGMVELYGRVMFVRVDLRHPAQTGDSKRLSQFIKSVKAYSLRVYQSQLGYLWAREQEKAKSQHYHVALMLDGDQIRHPAKLLEVVAEIWVRAGGTVAVPKKPYLFIDDEDTKQEAIYRASYLTKPRGKGYRPDGCRDFDGSRIPFGQRGRQK